MGRSQETFYKKQREKERAKKKREKQEKRESRRDSEGKGLEIDWASAPENSTLSEQEQKERSSIKDNNSNK